MLRSLQVNFVATYTAFLPIITLLLYTFNETFKLITHNFWLSSAPI